MGYIFLLIALILNASANILMKMGANSMKPSSSVGLLSRASEAMHNTYLMVGITLFALNVIFYVFALTKVKLSIAYPLMTSGGFLIISIASFLLFKETITSLQIVGIVTIILGIILVTHSL